MGRFVKVGDRIILKGGERVWVTGFTLQKKAMKVTGYPPSVEADGWYVPMSDFLDWDEPPKPDPMAQKAGEWELHVPRPGSKGEWVESYYGGSRVKATGHIAGADDACIPNHTENLLVVRVHDADECNRNRTNPGKPVSPEEARELDALVAKYK